MKKSSFLNYFWRDFEMRSWIKKIILTLGGMILIPNIAFATAVGKVVENLSEWLSGEIAGAVVVLVVIYSGYEMLHGEIDKRTFAVRLAAAGLIFGGSTIAKTILFQNVA